MRTINLTYSNVEAFVNEYQKSNDIFWDGWNIVIHKNDTGAFYSPKGRYYNGKWGYQHVTSPDDAGVWRVNARNLRFAKATSRK